MKNKIRHAHKNTHLAYQETMGKEKSKNVAAVYHREGQTQKQMGTAILRISSIYTGT